MSIQVEGKGQRCKDLVGYDAWKQRIEAAPDSDEILSEWLSDHDNATQRKMLINLQLESPSLISSVLLKLRETEDFRETLSAFSHKAISSCNPSISEELRIWHAVSNGKLIQNTCIDLTPKSIRLFAIFKAGLINIIGLKGVSEKDRAVLSGLGIDLHSFSLYMKDYLRTDTPWTKYLSDAEYASSDAPRIANSNDSFCGYQDKVVRNGFMEFQDPFSGALVRPLDSFFAFGRSCFLFPGKYPFFLICAGAGSKAMCIYIPQFDIIIDFKAGVNKYLSQELFSNLISIFTRRFSKHAENYNAAIVSLRDPTPEPKIVIALPQVRNPAHHVWNFFTGIERIILAGTQRNVTEIHFGGSEFFGPLDKIFPEFLDKIVHGERQSVIDPYPFSRSHVLLTVGGYFIPKTLTNRIYKNIGKLPAGVNSVSPNDFRNIKSRHPIIWFGMRKGDKSWLSQEEGIADIANKILHLHPGALILLDGFSFPVGRDEVTDQWHEVIVELRDLGDRVRSRITRPDAVVNMVGNTMRESVLWAGITDVYISPVGSTQHKIGWFSSADGIVYSAPRGTKPIQEMRLPGAWEAEGSRLPQYVIGTPIEAGERRGSGDRRAHLENMELDSNDLANRVIKLIEARLSASRRS